MSCRKGFTASATSASSAIASARASSPVCRELLGMQPDDPAAAASCPPADYRALHQSLTGTSLTLCPACGHGHMLVDRGPCRDRPAVGFVTRHDHRRGSASICRPALQGSGRNPVAMPLLRRVCPPSDHHFGKIGRIRRVLANPIATSIAADHAAEAPPAPWKPCRPHSISIARARGPRLSPTRFWLTGAKPPSSTAALAPAPLSQKRFLLSRVLGEMPQFA